jgi:MHS family citrate/tricarballylate:H+ symporter-like MFS transporter
MSALEQQATGAAGPAPAPEHDRKTVRRAVIASVLGNGLEFYDFLIYAFFAIQIGQTFFPSDDPFVSLMGSLAAFGAGFISRPLGALMLGTYADRHGRKPAMLASMMLMGAGIALLAFTPGYATIGIAAPILAVIARLLQGFALGGEVGTSTTFLIEIASPRRRGLITSLQGVSQGVASAAGSLVGLVLSLLLSDADLASWGWRIALMLGLLIVPVAVMVRRSLPETLHEGTGKAQTASAPTPAPSEWQGQSVKRTVVLGMTIIGARTIASYTFVYMATYGQNSLHFSTSEAMAGSLAGNVSYIFAAVIGGLMADRFGRRLTMVWPMLGLIVLIVPMFAWLDAARTLEVFIAANVVLSFFNYLTNAPVYVAIGESLPPHLRARGFSLIYSLPATVLGGTTQLVITWILYVTGDSMSVAWYLTGVSVIGLVAMALMRESAPGHRQMPPLHR